MMRAAAALLAVALALPGLAGEEFAPPEQLLPPPDDPRASANLPEWPEPVRRKVVEALTRINRDSILTGLGLVRSRVVAGELWFDLRGITVRRGEISGTAVLTRAWWDGARFEGVDLGGANFAPAVARGAVFNGCRLASADFEGVHVEGTDFIGTDLRGASFRHARLSCNTRFVDSTLDRAVFDHAVGSAAFIGGTAVEASFVGADLAGCQFVEVNLKDSTFRGSILDRTQWVGSRVDGADLTEASVREAQLNFLPGAPRLGRTVFHHTKLANLQTNVVDVAAIVWDGDDYRIGEEVEADRMPDSLVPHNKENLYRTAEVFYRTLARKYRDLGYPDEYLALRYRALEVRRKILHLVDRGMSTERLWLDISSVWDRHGTDLIGILRAYAYNVVIFAVIFWAAWLAARPWFLWEKIDEKAPAAETPAPHERLRAARGVVGKCRVVFELMIEALILSVETSLLFADNIIRHRQFFLLLRMRNAKLVPVGFGRPLVAMEAGVGILLAVSVLRRLTLLFGM